jgi:hypothetical protein
MKHNAIGIFCTMAYTVIISSCSTLFSEDTTRYGFLRAAVANANQLDDIFAPELEMRYYDYYSGEEWNSNKFDEPDIFSSEDEFLSRLPIGNYYFLTYTAYKNKIRHANSLADIEIFSDTIHSSQYDAAVIAYRQKMVYKGVGDGNIQLEDTCTRHFKMSPMVQTIQLNITVDGLSPTHVIESLEAMLSNVAIGRKVYTNQPIAEYAGVLFQFTKESKNKYTASEHVFGVSKTGSPELTIECAGNTFHKKFKVNLSKALSDFTQDGIIINILISIGDDMIAHEIKILDWQDMPQSEIKLSPTINKQFKQ